MGAWLEMFSGFTVSSLFVKCNISFSCWLHNGGNACDVILVWSGENLFFSKDNQSAYEVFDDLAWQQAFSLSCTVAILYNIWKHLTNNRALCCAVLSFVPCCAEPSSHCVLPTDKYLLEREQCNFCSPSKGFMFAVCKWSTWTSSLFPAPLRSCVCSKTFVPSKTFKSLLLPLNSPDFLF